MSGNEKISLIFLHYVTSFFGVICQYDSISTVNSMNCNAVELYDITYVSQVALPEIPISVINKVQMIEVKVAL